MTTPLRKGDLVEVRSPDEILATLDANGELDALPFMPEMASFCGQVFTVAARAEKVCDTIDYRGSRRIDDTVLLEDLRCGGGGHDGCEAACTIYWKEAWLKPASGTPSLPPPADDDPATLRLLGHIEPAIRRSDDRGQVHYRCQATRMLAASTALSMKDPRPYLAAYTSGNVNLGHFVRVMGRAAVMETRRQLGRLPDPPVCGPSSTSPKTPRLGLQPGEWVRVKSRDEIEPTLNDMGKNRGLWFDREMLPFCGRVFQVKGLVTRLIDERDGHMIELTSDCVILEDAFCSGERSLGRWFCPRAIYPYWREAWLERVEVDGSERAQADHDAAGRTPEHVV